MPEPNPMHSAQQLTAIHRIARIALQDLAMRPMLQRIVDALFEEFHWDFIACVRIDPSTNEFVCEALKTHLRTDIAVGYRRAIGSGVVGECALSGKTIDIDDARNHPNFIDTLDGTRSELCVPVIFQGEVLAILNAESLHVGAFRGQRALLETVADQIAGVIHASRLLDQVNQANQKLAEAYQQMSRLAQLDGLTGILNRRSFDSNLRAAVQDAIETKDVLSLILIDIDYFKNYNDALGHLEGDACLRQVAQLLEAKLKDEAAARLARYGGEEFGVILPCAKADVASDLAEQLRTLVQSQKQSHPASPFQMVTISVGVALFDAATDVIAAPKNLETEIIDATNQLIARADGHLYAAKRGGRNRVVAG